MLEKEIKESLQEILGLCLDVKLKGHDAFFSYQPHVDWLTVRVFLNGWVGDRDCDNSFDFIWTTLSDDSDEDQIKIVFDKHAEVKDCLRKLAGVK